MRPLNVMICVLVLAAPAAELVRAAEGGSPKDQTEELLNAGIPFAEKMIGKNGEFYPFAFAMTAAGKVVAVAAPAPSDHPKSTEVIGDLTTALRAGVSGGKYKATAIFSDVRVQPPSKPDKTDAVQASLEHASGYCVDVFVPYSRGADGKPVFGDLFAQKRTGTVVDTCK